jgi:uncharacterized repeat protein (TIGR03803 family)
MSAIRFSRLVLASIFCAALVLTLLAALPAGAQTPTTVYGFPGVPGPINPNIEAIAQGRDGNLYFTAGGGDGKALNCTVTYCGTAIKMTTAGAVTDIFDFSNNNCTVDNCGNGAYGGLTLGTDGNFYGAFYYGGTTGNNGEVFKLTPAGVLTALHNFTGASDGSHPYGAPIESASGIFYGTTSSATVADSTVYSVTSAGVFTTLHTFTGPDGQNIVAPLVQGTDGNFYGDTVAGGTSNDGVIFKMSPSGTVTVLHNFAGTDGSNGSFPLIQASDGNLYGSAYSGGSSGAGVIFKITPTGTYTVLHNINGTTDGNGPWGSLVQATNGTLYGTTSNIGIGLYGTIFSITTTGTFTTLYSFTGQADGGVPLSPLRQHTNGLLYGTTEVGGDTNCYSAVGINGQENIVVGCGELYSLNIDAKPFVSLVSTSGKVGSTVGILGQDFTSASVVTFGGGVEATTTKLTGTTFILATVPTGAIDGKVTVTTGSTKLTSAQSYIVHNSWSSGAAMPTGTVYSSAAVLGGEIYVIGGDNASGTVLTDVQIYNPTTNKWSTGTPLPTATDATSAAVVNNILYVFGGSTTSSVTGAVWAYSPKTKAWTSMAPMPTPRNGTLAVVEKNIVYVMGGNLGGGPNFVATVESYDPATNTWTKETPMDGAKDYPGGGLIGTTIVAGDGSPAGSAVTGDTEGYNTTTNAWSELTADPTARTGPCSGVIGSTLYDASGYINNAGAATTVNESYSLSANKWTTTLLPIPQGTMFPASAVANGQLYCIGGWAVVNSTAISNVQIYQP